MEHPRVIREGYLEFKMKGQISWRRMWFSLCPPLLNFYFDKADAHSAGSFMLEDMLISQDTTEGCIVLRHSEISSYVIRLTCVALNELDVWWNALKGCCGVEKNQVSLTKKLSRSVMATSPGKKLRRSSRAFVRTKGPMDDEELKRNSIKLKRETVFEMMNFSPEFNLCESEFVEGITPKSGTVSDLLRWTLATCGERDNGNANSLAFLLGYRVSFTPYQLADELLKIYEYLESFLQDQIDALEWTKKRFFIFLYLWFENWGTDDFDDALASRLLFFMRSSIGRAQADRIEFIWSECVKQRELKRSSMSVESTQGVEKKNVLPTASAPATPRGGFADAELWCVSPRAEDDGDTVDMCHRRNAFTVGVAPSPFSTEVASVSQQEDEKRSTGNDQPEELGGSLCPKEANSSKSKKKSKKHGRDERADPEERAIEKEVENQVQGRRGKDLREDSQSDASSATRRKRSRKKSRESKKSSSLSPSSTSLQHAAPTATASESTLPIPHSMTEGAADSESTRSGRESSGGRSYKSAIATFNRDKQPLSSLSSPSETPSASAGLTDKKKSSSIRNSATVRGSFTHPSRWEEHDKPTRERLLLRAESQEKLEKRAQQSRLSPASIGDNTPSNLGKEGSSDGGNMRHRHTIDATADRESEETMQSLLWSSLSCGEPASIRRDTTEDSFPKSSRRGLSRDDSDCDLGRTKSAELDVIKHYSSRFKGHDRRERGSSFIRIPPPPPKLVANNFDVSCWAQLPSRVLAEQMTLVDAYYVYSLSPSDLIGSQRAPSVEILTGRFNTIASWVSTLVVFAEAPKRQAQIQEKLIKIAWHCSKIRNYFTSKAIVGGMDVISVSRLKKPLVHMSPKAREYRNALDHLFSPLSNYAAYRSLSFTPPCLPLIPVVMKDLISIEEGNQTFLDEHQMMVNFEKMQLSASVIYNLGLHAAMHVPYPIAPVASLMDMMAHVQGKSENDVYEKSLQCEPKHKPLPVGE